MEIYGSGDATVWASETLGVLIDASGSVNYCGSPTLNSTISGSSDVYRLGDKRVGPARKPLVQLRN
ncbi:hypothetical protein ACFLV7_06245 [Chloroflexota bacterium]